MLIALTYVKKVGGALPNLDFSGRFAALINPLYHAFLLFSIAFSIKFIRAQP